MGCVASTTVLHQQQQEQQPTSTTWLPASPTQATPRTPFSFIVDGDLDSLVEYWRTESDLSITDDNGDTLLHTAAKCNNVAALMFLIHVGLDVNQTNAEQERNALHVAATHGHYESVQYLLEVGGDINAYDFMFSTPLHCAAASRHPLIVELLLREGANPNAFEAGHGFGATPLATACGIDDNLRSIVALIRKGADIHVATCIKETPLHIAARSAEQKTVKYLITKGANLYALDDKGSTSLQAAVHSFRFENACVIADAMLQYSEGRPSEELLGVFSGLLDPGRLSPSQQYVLPEVLKRRLSSPLPTELAGA